MKHSKEYTTSEIDFVRINNNKLTCKEQAKILNVTLARVINLRKLFVANRGRVTRPRKYNLNDYSFSKLDQNNCYWAGFIAADGSITQDNRQLIISCQLSDISHIKRFKEFVNFEGPIHEYTIQYSYKGKSSLKYACSISLSSQQIVMDLKEKFNITQRKSLTLIPPNIIDTNHIDAFILGYLDGDGHIGLHNKLNKSKRAALSIAGTFEMLKWIELRFSQVLNIDSLNCVYKGSKNAKNTYLLVLSDKRARNIIKHYFNCRVPKMDRKWTEELNNYCCNYTIPKKVNCYLRILKLDVIGKSNNEIAEMLQCTPSNVAWHKRQIFYQQLKTDFTKSLKQDLTNEPL